MTLLITGADGFVGRRLAQVSVAKGLDVLAVDAGFGARSPRANELQLDLTDPCDLARLAEMQNIEGCIHLAAVSTERAAQENPTKAKAVNVTATQALLEMACAKGWRRFVTASTASVFQDVDLKVSGIPEETPPSPRQLYARTKHRAEQLTSHFRQSRGVSAASVRLTGVYGPPRVPTGPVAIPIAPMLKRALTEETVAYDSGGDWANAYTYVDDAAGGLLALFQADQLNHDIFHLSPGQNHTAYQIATAIEAVVPGASVRLGSGTDPWGQSLVARPPLIGARLKSDTGFTPQVTLNEGIRRFADWMRKDLQK